MLDIAVAYNRYKFLGCEFLTWLWFMIENDQPRLRRIMPEVASIVVGNRVKLENRSQNSLESITIKGDDAGLEEGLLSLRKGAVVVELNIVATVGEQEWRTTFKGESFHLSNLRPPDTGAMETSEDLDGFLLEKVYLYDKLIHWMDDLFVHFLKIRLSETWRDEGLLPLVSWIEGK